MEQQSNTPGDKPYYNQTKDPALWEIAKRRAGFKSHLAVYVVINTFLWGIWFFNGREFSDLNIPWPAWSSVGWGIGLIFHYLGAYVFPRENSAEKEYEKLLSRRMGKDV